MIGWSARQWRRALMLGGMLASGKAADLLYEFNNRRKGLDLAFASVEDLGLPGARAHWYSDSGGPQLSRVLDSLRIAPGSVGLDFGSGKGGAAITMARHRFARVTGVELSARLADIARENVRRAGLRNVDFVACDASEFRDLDDYTHVYLYNPFPCAVLGEVLDNLRASLARRDRAVTLIYKNPVCDDAVAASGLFEKEREIKPAEHWWYIYRHHPASGTSPESKSGHRKRGNPSPALVTQKPNKADWRG
jgi:SAM-dependent methyltransferase